jgi:flagellar biosynthesis/type III secretory pathway chaperone
LPYELGTKNDLEQWVEKLQLGEYEAVYMNTYENAELQAIVKNYDSTLHRLERAYMTWAINIYQAIHEKYGRFFHGVSGTKKHFLIENSMTLEEKALCTEQMIMKARPRIKTTSSPTAESIDEIKYYLKSLSELETKIRDIRVHPGRKLSHRQETRNSLARIREYYDGRKIFANSAFVTFFDPISAYRAQQMLLHAATDGYTMRVSGVPCANEVLWENISNPYLDKLFYRTIISWFAFALSVVWVVPTYYVAGLTVIGIDEKESPYLSVFIKAVIPPLIISIFSNIMPLFLDCSIT